MSAEPSYVTLISQRDRIGNHEVLVEAADAHLVQLFPQQTSAGRAHKLVFKASQNRVQLLV